MKRTPILIYVIGATNAGKSTLMDAVRQDVTMGTIEVGKMMRAKYPPEHFAGQSNPKHTANEAWQMYLDGIAAQQDKTAIWCDGQPRDMVQLDAILCQSKVTHPRFFVHLWCLTSVRERRAEKRDGQDPAKLALSMGRMQGDLPSLYEIISRLLLMDENLLTVGTSIPGYDPVQLVSMMRTQVEAMHKERARV
jgi:hypothetical protein